MKYFPLSVFLSRFSDVSFSLLWFLDLVRNFLKQKSQLNLSLSKPFPYFMEGMWLFLAEQFS